MARILLQYLLPLLLPFLVYIAWVAFTRGRRPGWLDDTPWVPLLSAGVVLLGASLFGWSLTVGDPPGARYRPPHFEGGRVVPADAVEQEQD
jgi:hypothetical protein